MKLHRSLSITSEKAEIPKSTESQTAAYATRFKEFLNSKGLPNMTESMLVRFLNQYLRLFYSSLREEDGSLSAPATLEYIRAAINRYLTSVLNQRMDKEFEDL